MAVPDWYESPGWARLEKLLAEEDGAAEKLAGFTGAVVAESRDREVHVKHRVRVQGYPLVVVLGALSSNKPSDAKSGKSGADVAKKAAKDIPEKINPVSSRRSLYSRLTS